ncbi:LysR family transcriptional regulator [Roseobacter sinensis]|uniref:LysR family transcriptional regulator n=1 Tax=Roseobacter sinensis TaxID=2931391 RepID=A0ABT3BFB1_9RHOB|nr:LysR family transcriptional regulator [Roseobacter sp. WL0113]MCV3272269.1 LysR family transcriptional regulator [Roseobacter sp. WL0113]
MKGITLRGLEVFEALASTGSVAQAAARTGLSQPAVSQQLRNLETAIGVELVDHRRRPMRLTPAGTLFLHRAEAALTELRLARSEITVMDLAHLKALSIGIIDDFDDSVTPRLATILAESLTGCKFKMITASSNDLAAAMAEKRLHLAISASTGRPIDGVVEHALARDPFMRVAPRGAGRSETELPDPGGLPFLRYDNDQLIRQQIEAHLASELGAHPERFEIGSHLALMAMVARGIGWTITTPLGFMRAHRFHTQIEAFPLPGPPFARQISLFASEDWADDVPLNIAQTMRRLIQTHMIDPALSDLPFLSGELEILPP